MDKYIQQKILEQVFTKWINPEINKRKEREILQNNFTLKKAQVLFSLDRSWNKVRLNEEVKAIVKCVTNVSINKGDVARENNIENICEIKLTSDDPNCAHITILRLRSSWILAFDFGYNRGRLENHVAAAEEFLKSTKDNALKSRLRPFCEDAFACAELLAKATLLQLPDQEVLHGTSHETRIIKFEKWAELGNVDDSYSKLLRKLKSLRPSARYLHSTVYAQIDTAEIISTLENMLADTKELLQK